MPVVGPRFSHARIQRPQQVFAPSPVVPPLLTAQTATGTLTNWRRAQQRRWLVVHGTPIVETGGVGAISPGGLYGGQTFLPNLIFGRAGANVGQRAVGFVPSAAITATSLAVFLGKTAAPSDNAIITLQTDDGSGNPSGTILATLTVAGSAISATQAKLFSTAISVALSAGTQYWIVFSRDGSLDSTNYYRCFVSDGSSSNPTYPLLQFVSSWASDTSDLSIYFSLLTAGDTLAALSSSVGPQPPLVIGPVPGPPPVDTTIAVTLATFARRNTEQRRFPKQWYEPSETDIGAPRPSAASIIVYPERALGPDPPAVLAIPPPVDTTVAVTLAAQSRRQTESRRFPLPGYDETLVLGALGSPNTPNQPLLDDFNRANESPLSQGGNWVNGSTAAADVLRVVSNQASGPATTNATFFSLYQAAGTLTDCEAYLTRTGALGSFLVVARATQATTGNNIQSGYGFLALTGGGLTLVRYDSGSSSTIASGSATTAATGDTLAIRCYGTTIEGWLLHAGVWQRIYSVTDTTYASGDIGIGLAKTISGAELGDDFHGGSFSASGGLSYVSVSVLTRRRLGPFPPVVLAVSLASPVSVTLASQYRRQTEARRFPLQGWEGWGATQDLGGGGAIEVPANLRSARSFGNATTSSAVAQQFLARLAAQVVAVEATLQTNGSPTDDLVLQLQTSASSKPTGTILATWTIPAGSLTGTPTLYQFSIPSSLTLVAGTRYFLVFSRDGSLDAANFYSVWIDTNDPGPDVFDILVSGTWQITASSTAPIRVLFNAGTPSGAFYGYQRLLGPRPPMLILPLPTQRVAVTPVAIERRNTQRRAMYDLFGFIPQVSAQPPPPISVTLAKTRPRRTVSLYTQAPYLSPLAVVTTPGQLVVFQHARAARPRHVQSSLPTVLVASTFIAPPLNVNCLPPDRLARRYHRAPPVPGATLFPPSTLQIFSGPTVTTVAARTMREQPRHYPLPGWTGQKVTVAGESGNIPVGPHHLTRRNLGPWPPLRVLALPTLRAQTVGATLVRTRPRHTLGTQLGALIFYPVADTTVAVALTKTRPRPISRFVAPPATLQPYSITVAEDTIRVALARTRPRPTRRNLGPPVFYPATSDIQVTLVKTRPRPTHALRRGLIFYAQADYTIAVQTVRARPRHTTRFVAPPATLQPYAVTVAEDTIRVAIARIRPRPTARHLYTPIVLQTFAGPAVTLVKTRPRPTARRLAQPVFLPATSSIAVAIVRTRPRPTRHLLTAITYPQTGVGFQHVVRTRPRPTTQFLLPPATLEPEPVALAERTIRTWLVRTRPRHTLGTRLGYTVYAATSEIQVTLSRTRPRPTRKTLQPPVFYAATSEISVALARIRPRPTTRRLSDVSYPATSELAVTLARIRPRPTTKFVAPPATLQPYAVTVAEDTIRVSLVRTRPRHTAGTKLAPPTTLQTFFGPRVALTRTRPRPTIRYLLPPTVIRVPSVEQLEDTIRVTVVRTRPRPTITFLVPPLVKTFPPVVTTFLPAHLVQTRPRPTRKYVAAPRVVIPPATLDMQTITVVLVRSRPRPTRHSLGPLAFYRQTSTIRVVLARTRPRSTRRFLAPPAELQTFGPPLEVEVAVRTPIDDRAHRRVRSLAIRPVTYPATSEISVTLVRTRPRPTTHRLETPTVLQVFRGPSTPTVRTRPRPTRSVVRPPATLEPYPIELAEREERVALVRTRPRPTTRFLRPPTSVRVFAAAPVLIVLARTRPRPTVAHLKPPTRLRPPETTLRTHLARIRPAHVRSTLAPAVVTAEPAVVTTLAINLAVTRPRVFTRSRLAPPTVVAPPVQPVITAITTELVRTRPRPQSATLEPPTIVRPPTPPSGIGQATGYATATASATGEKVATAAATGEKVATTGATGDVAETSGATGDSESTSQATGDTRP